MTTHFPDVDSYIASFPESVQDILEQVRRTIREAAPDAEETISYGMPTLILNGNLVHFAAFKKYIGFYPVPSAIDAFKDELADYKGAKGSIHFPFDKPLPLDLLSRITKFRVGENAKKAALTPQRKTAIKPKKRTEQEQVTDHIQQLDPELAQTVDHIRQLILSTDSEIGERIKWNNPSFYYTGDMKPFNPNEYKRDIAVFNLHKGKIRLVFPSGAALTDPTGLLDGNYTDGRRIMVFTDLNDVKSKAKAIQDLLKEWLAFVEK